MLQFCLLIKISMGKNFFFFREIRYQNSWNWFPYNIHVNEKVCTLHQFSYHHLVFRMIYYIIIVRPYFSSFHPNLMASLSAIFNGRFHHFCAPLAAFTYLLSFYYEKRLGKRSRENTWYYFWATTQVVKFGKKINGKKSEMAHSNFRNIWLKSMWKS